MKYHSLGVALRACAQTVRLSWNICMVVVKDIFPSSVFPETIMLFRIQVMERLSLLFGSMDVAPGLEIRRFAA